MDRLLVHSDQKEDTVTLRFHDQPKRVRSRPRRERSAVSCLPFLFGVKAKKKTHLRARRLYRSSENTKVNTTMQIRYQPIQLHSSRIQGQLLVACLLFLVGCKNLINAFLRHQKNILESGLCCQMRGWVTQFRSEADRRILDVLWIVLGRPPTPAFS